jgi:hypothetical protein
MFDTHKITINVTQEHLDEGVCGDPERCPIALAVKQQHGFDVSVGDYGIEYYAWDVRLPHKARDFIREFDFDRPSAKPFTFEIEIPD